MGGAIGTGLILGSEQVIQSVGPSIILGLCNWRSEIAISHHASTPVK